MKYFTPTHISENIRETPEGFLVCIGVPIARTGEMIYDETEIPLDADGKGKIVINREESEVFRPETIASFEGKPITITHPKEFVNPNNWKDLAKGTVQNVRRGMGVLINSLVADLHVTDSVAINLIKSGLREVSCGYEADWIQHEAGKGSQTNIVGNHLALVDQGRAGPGYAINDHKSKGEREMKLNKDKIKSIFAKAQDDALAALDAMSPQDPATGKPAELKDAGDKAAADAASAGMDELKKMVADLGERINAMSLPHSAPKDAETEKESKEKEEKTGDEEEESSVESTEEATLESRLSAVEAAVAKLLEGQSEEDFGDESGEEAEDAGDAGDDDFEETTMTGDSVASPDVLSRAEILAPGIKPGKDVMVRALKASYATKEGKKAIDTLNGGKAPAFDSADKVKSLFTSASELLKVMRSKNLSRTKQRTGDEGDSDEPTVMTAEMMNKKNEEFYKRA